MSKRRRKKRRKRGVRDSLEYRRWCKAVYTRDKFKCVCCGKRGWLNPHHLNGWNWCTAGRYLVRNGVTLCAGPGSCHNNFHDMYGRGDNTTAQFRSFMKKYYNKDLNSIVRKAKDD